MKFRVRYLHKDTQQVIDEVAEGPTAEDVRLRLTAAGSVVLQLKETTSASTRAFTQYRTRSFDMAWWCRELKTLLDAGMTVVEAIETLTFTNKEEGIRGTVQHALLKALQEGQSLSRAMASTGVFPEVLVASVKASERTSTLPTALEDYLRYDAMLGRLRRQAVSSAIYPAVVVGLGVLIAAFLLVFVIPRFSTMYVDFHGTLSPATQAVLWLSRMLAHHLPVVLAVLAGAAGLVVMAWQRGWLTQAVVAVVESVTVLRQPWDHFRLAKLYQSLALMFRGGYTLDEALLVCEGLNLGSRINHSVAIARREIAQGKSASSAFATAELTQGVTQRLLAVGERTGSFDHVLQHIADRHSQAFETFVERATRIVEPLLLLLVALVVGGIVVMMYMPIFDMANGVGSAP